MLADLIVNGEPVTLLEDDDQTVQLESDTETSSPQYRCRACSRELARTPDGFESDDHGPCCPEYEPTGDTGLDYGEGPHDPERIPLAWCNHAGITTDPEQDAITVTASVGDPRGAFAFTLRRIPDDAHSELAGRLVLHVPHPDEPSLHMELTPVRPGTYVIGSQPYASRAQAQS
ncbi:hypothetical protein [Salinactinospora qingdaonensis]|uniref:Uncharacterized protein n=1 Tax=Salinactinospora qingdaonensis TaxID=702744 RepID=A0ABP7FPJ2_9ACTN